MASLTGEKQWRRAEKHQRGNQDKPVQNSLQLAPLSSHD